MDDDDLFDKYAQGANNPEQVKRLIDELKLGAAELSGQTVLNLTTTVASATRAVSHLGCAAMIARGEALLQFLSDIDRETGKSFGAKLITVAKKRVNIPPDLAVAWSGLQQNMASAIEMLIRKYKGPTTSEHMLAWLNNQGGIGQLHMAYMRERQHEEHEHREREARVKAAGERAIKEEEAKTAGFATVEEHEAHKAEQDATRQREQTEARFAKVRRELVENGSEVSVLIREFLRNAEGRLFIAQDGKLFVISEDDEYKLIACMASTVR